MHRFAWVLVAAALVSPSFLAMAQVPSAAPVGGTVTGLVICGDTQRPAKFADVKLFGIPEEITPAPKPGDALDNAKYHALFKTTMDKAKIVETQTDAEGRFSMADVPPGDYYGFAWLPGYLEPQTVMQTAADAGVALDKPIPGIPIVHVASERSSQVGLTMERGAAVSGRVVWDDGGPVTGAMVTVVPAKGKEKALPIQIRVVGTGMSRGGAGTITYSNDLGEFRIAGLAVGHYLVMVTLETHDQFALQDGVSKGVGMAISAPLTVFAPAAFHKADAEAVTLHAGEERDDEEITFRLSGMYSVSGRVTSAEDGHGLNSAMVKLSDVQDKEFSRWATVDVNGNFTITFVPSGSYSLEVSGARDVEPSQKKMTDSIVFGISRTLRSYEGGKQAVVVMEGDVTGQNFALGPTKATKKDVGSAGAEGH